MSMTLCPKCETSVDSDFHEFCTKCDFPLFAELCPDCKENEGKVYPNHFGCDDCYKERFPTPLVWTKEKPTKKGWYWYSHSVLGTFIIEVFVHPDTSDGKWFYVNWESGKHYKETGVNNVPEGLWSGPIPEPKESE